MYTFFGAIITIMDYNRKHWRIQYNDNNNNNNKNNNNNNIYPGSSLALAVFSGSCKLC